MDTQLRYCTDCDTETRHDIRNQTTTGEKVFFGVATVGLIPFFEGMTPNSKYWGKIAKCQRCSKTTKIK
jgi:hypothetical protein